MAQYHDPARAHATTVPEPDDGADARRFPMTDLPTKLMALLIALGVPRTVLADLDIVPPESGLLYYFLALMPFAAWLAVAIVRRSRRPFRDHLMVGVLYGLSLVVIHQVLWGVGPSLGHNPPASAVEFADQFSGGWRDLALRGYTSGIAMIIGIGSGFVVGVVAVGSKLWRSTR
jgi:hypothetical protein